MLVVRNVHASDARAQCLRWISANFVACLNQCVAESVRVYGSAALSECMSLYLMQLGKRDSFSKILRRVFRIGSMSVIECASRCWEGVEAARKVSWRSERTYMSAGPGTPRLKKDPPSPQISLDFHCAGLLNWHCLSHGKRVISIAHGFLRRIVPPTRLRFQSLSCV